ncbi:MAG: hypothetical protein P8123_04930 [bacterium]
MSKTKVFIYCCITAVALGIGACARKTIVLENRFAKGEEIRYLLTTKGEGTMSITGLPGQKSGTETAINLRTELAYTIKVKDVDTAGSADVECTFQHFKSTTQSGAMKIQTEADESGVRVMHGKEVIKGAPGIEDLRAIFENPTLLKIDKRGKILSITPPSGVDLHLPHVNVCNILKQNQVLLPAGPVAVGGSWTEKRDIVLGGGMEERLPWTKGLKLDTTYSLDGIVDHGGRECADIAVRGDIAVKDMELSPPGGSDMPMSVRMDHLKQRLDGHIYFDQQRRRVLGFHLATAQDAAVTMKMAKEGVAPFKSSTKMKMEADLKLLE